MTSKNEILEQSDNQQRSSSLVLSSRLCLLFLIVCISAPHSHAETLSQDIDPTNLLDFPLEPNPKTPNTTNTSDHLDAPSRILETPVQIAKLSERWQIPTSSSIAINFAAKVDEKSSDLFIAKTPTTLLSRQLWQARITSPKDENAGNSEAELRQIIEQISAIEFKQQEQTSEPLIVLESLKEKKTDSSETSIAPKVQQGEEPDKIERKLVGEQITDQTLQILKDMSQHPDQLSNPFELAEILFSSGCLEEAVKCYQQALGRISVDEADPFHNKAWILFQIGNCLQNTDATKANKMYKQLIDQCSDSPWTDLAEVRSKLIDWYQLDKPEELITENQF